MKEFLAFLKEYGVIGLAIAVIIGLKLGELIKSVVDQLLMPLIGIVVPGGDWRTLGFTVAGARFGVGPVLGALLDFFIVAGLVFLIAKMVLKETQVGKK